MKTMIIKRIGVVILVAAVALSFGMYTRAGAESVNPGDTIDTYAGKKTTINAWVEAEDFSIADSHGVSTASNGTTGTGCLAGAHNGSYACYKNVDFGTITKGFVYSFSIGKEGECANRTTLKIHIDSVDGEEIPVRNTVRWVDADKRSYDNWNIAYCNSNEFSGVHDVYLVFKSDEKLELARLDYFYLTTDEQLEAEETTPTPSVSPDPSVSPIPTSSPEATASPEASLSPEPSASPEPTVSPKPSTAPVPTGTPIPTVPVKKKTYYIHCYCEGSGIARSKKLFVKVNAKTKKMKLTGIGYKTSSKKWTTAKKYKKKYKNKIFKVTSNFKITSEETIESAKGYHTFRQEFGTKGTTTLYGPLATIKVVNGKIARIDCGS